MQFSNVSPLAITISSPICLCKYLNVYALAQHSPLHTHTSPHEEHIFTIQFWHRQQWLGIRNISISSSSNNMRMGSLGWGGVMDHGLVLDGGLEVGM